MHTIRIGNRWLAAEIAPENGGGLTRFDWVGDGEPLRVFQPAVASVAAARADPEALACYALLPWSNRIGGGFSYQGRAVRLPRNRADEPWPIHGEGWLAAWRVVEAGDDGVALELDRTRGVPYAYRATQTYRLREGTLTIRVEIENRGPLRMPFGLGLHPFLPREAGLTLAASAEGVWLRGADGLPGAHVPVPAWWSFRGASPLPASLIDHAFTGWPGAATLIWPARRLRLDIAADAGCFVLYTPVDEGFFCFEPVDHPINAVNLPGGGEAHGMTGLAPGERLARQFSFAVARL